MRTAPISFTGYNTNAYSKGIEEIMGYTNKDCNRISSIVSIRQKIEKAECSDAKMITKEFLEGARRFFSASINEAKGFFNPKNVK